jgi:hypothetical protein
MKTDTTLTKHSRTAGAPPRDQGEDWNCPADGEQSERSGRDVKAALQKPLASIQTDPSAGSLRDSVLRRRV